MNTSYLIPAGGLITPLHIAMIIIEICGLCGQETGIDLEVYKPEPCGVFLLAGEEEYLPKSEFEH